MVLLPPPLPWGKGAKFLIKNPISSVCVIRYATLYNLMLIMGGGGNQYHYGYQWRDMEILPLKKSMPKAKVLYVQNNTINQSWKIHSHLNWPLYTILTKNIIYNDILKINSKRHDKTHFIKSTCNIKYS